VQPGHESAMVTGGDVVDAYEKAQKYPTVAKITKL
jgi:hypothetical protein